MKPELDKFPIDKGLFLHTNHYVYSDAQLHYAPLCAGYTMS